MRLNMMFYCGQPRAVLRPNSLAPIFARNSDHCDIYAQYSSGEPFKCFGIMSYTSEGYGSSAIFRCWFIEKAGGAAEYNRNTTHSAV